MKVIFPVAIATGVLGQEADQAAEAAGLKVRDLPDGPELPAQDVKQIRPQRRQD